MHRASRHFRAIGELLLLRFQAGNDAAMKDGCENSCPKLLYEPGRDQRMQTGKADEIDFVMREPRQHRGRVPRGAYLSRNGDCVEAALAGGFEPVASGHSRSRRRMRHWYRAGAIAVGDATSLSRASGEEIRVFHDQ